MAVAGNSGGAGGASNLARARRKPKRREPPRPGPPQFPSAVPSHPGAVTGTGTRGHGPPPPNRPTFQIPHLESAPGARKQQQAGRRARRAAPAPALPRVPIIQQPNHRQIEAARTVISGALAREAKRRGQGPGETIRQLAQDPRTRHFARAASHYARASERATAAQVGTRAVPKAPALPYPRIGPLATDSSLPVTNRSARIRAGREIIRGHVARNQFGPAPPPMKVKALGFVGPKINLTAVSRALAGATTLNQGDLGPRTALGKITGDVKTLATGPFVGGYELGAAAVEGLKKRPYLLAATPLFGGLTAAATTKRGQKLGKGVLKGVTESSPAALVTGHPGLAAKRFGEHPLIEALNYAALESAVGRTVGAGIRAAGSTPDAPGVRGALARAGSTVRPPVALADELGGGTVQRTASKDPFRKFFQVASDRARERLRDAEGNVVTVTDRGREVPVLKSHPIEREHLQRITADFEHARENAASRQAREEASRESRVRRRGVTKAARAEGISGREARDVVSMVTEGTILSARDFEAQLRAHRDRIAGHLEEDANAAPHERIYRDTAARKAAEKRVELADSILESPKRMAQAERIVAAGEKAGERLVAGDARKAELRLADSEELRRARLKVAAVEHMGARHYTVEQHAALERDALAAERAARERADKLPAGPEKMAARAELAEARARRIAVSGRDPYLVNAHEDAVAFERNARREHQAAQAEVARLQNRRQRILGKQSSRRSQGRKVGEGARAATVAERRELEKIDKSIKAAQNVAEEARKKRARARHKVRKNPMPDIGEGLRRPGGEYLGTGEIEDFIRSKGRDPGTVAYLPSEVSSRQFYSQFRPGGRGTVTTGQVRTGAAHEKGTTEASAELLRAAGVRDAITINKAEHIDRQIGDHGIRHPAWAKAERGQELTPKERRIVDRGGLWTGREAEEAITRIRNDTGEEYVAVRAYPGKLDQESQRIIRENLQGPGAMESLPERLWNSRILHEGEFDARARNVVLMPASYVERQIAHLAPAQGLERFFQVLNRPFRYAVLPQFRWLTGNFVEPYIVRLTASGSGLNVFGLAADIRAANREIKVMERSGDPRIRQAAKDLRAQQLGSGLFVGGGEVRSIHRKLEDVAPKLYGKMVSKFPAAAQMADMIGNAVHLLAAPLRLFFGINRVIETGAQRAGFGHQVRRDLQDITGSWAKSMVAGQKALDDLAKGLVNTPAQHRFMREQEVLLGKYAGFSPWMRRLTQSITPFIPWFLNATRFIFWTMPAHHSALTALLVKVNDVVAKDWETQHANLPPGNLRLAIPNGKGGWIDLARYTPWGAFEEAAGGGSFESLVNQFAPQVSGVEQALRGKDPFGRDLLAPPTPENPKGTVSGLGLLGVAANQALGALVPYLSQIQRLREGGGTPYATSNIISPKTKPGSKHVSAPSKILNPFNPTYLKGKAVELPAVHDDTSKLSPQQQRLVKAAERQAGAGLSDRQLELLTRAAERAAGIR